MNSRRLTKHTMVLWAFEDEEPTAMTWGEWVDAHGELERRELYEIKQALLADVPWRGSEGGLPKYALYLHHLDVHDMQELRWQREEAAARARLELQFHPPVRPKRKSRHRPRVNAVSSRGR